MIDYGTYVTALRDDLKSVGSIERVYSHLPKNAPGKGVSAAVMFDHMEALTTSGLASIDVLIQCQVILYANQMQEPQDDINTRLLDVLSQVWVRYIGGFTLEGLVMQIDLLGGESGQKLEADPGFVELDGSIYKAILITVPIIVTQAFDQAR